MYVSVKRPGELPALCQDVQEVKAHAMPCAGVRGISQTYQLVIQAQRRVGRKKTGERRRAAPGFSAWLLKWSRLSWLFRLCLFVSSAHPAGERKKQPPLFF